MQDDTFDTDTETFEGNKPQADLPQADPPEAVAVQPAQGPDTRVLVEWRDRQYEVVCTQYIDNGNTCIALLDPESGSVEAKATANLSKLSPHRVYIKDYSENRGIAKALVSKGLLQKAGEGIRKGSVTFGEYEILPKLGGPFNIKAPEPYMPPMLDESLEQTIEGEDSKPITG